MCIRDRGTIDAVEKNQTIAGKKDLESKFQVWALLPENQAVYGGGLEDIKLSLIHI